MENFAENFDSNCHLSESVFAALKHTYSPTESELEEKVVYKRICSIISIPPIISILRVNTIKEDIQTARSSLQRLMNRKYANSTRQFNVSLHEKIPDILMVTRTSERSQICPVKEEVIVGELCGVAVLRGASVFAPGVMGAPSGLKKDDTVAIYADLDAKCRKGFTKIYAGRKHFVGNGRAIVSRDELFKDCSSPPKGIAVEMTSSLFGLPSFDELDAGLYFAQNLPSLLVGHNLELKKDEIVLDMCAAPGGKTTHAAILLGNTGKVIAIDKSKSKISKMQQNCLQQNLTNVICHAFDSTKLCENENNVAKEYSKPPFPPESFDKIILDPPCSALGQRPQLQCKMTSQELDSFPVYQRKLFRQGVKLLKPGGILIYSTCTLTVSENENQVAWAISNFAELTLVPQKIHLGRFGITGHELDDSNCKLVQRFDPCLNNITRHAEDIRELTVNEDTIGFFIAKFRKNDGF